MTPKVSVVVPVYNVEPWLRKCLDSILAQSLREVELIAVDDGSPDRCGIICDEYAARDSRVHVIHKPNGGVMPALTDGIRAASAPYVGFVDSDDWIDAGYFADLYEAAVRTDADVVCAEHIRHSPDGDVPVVRRQQTLFPAPDGGRRFLAQYYARLSDDAPPYGVNARWNKLYRRGRLLDALPYFPPDVWHGEDLVANAAVLADCACVVQLAGKAKYHYLIRAGSLTGQSEARADGGRWAENELAFLRAMGRVVRDKGLLPGCFGSYLGRSAYAAVLDRFSRRDIPRADRRLYALRVLELTPPGTLEAYARERKSPLVSLYCALLRARRISPCMAIASLYARSGPRRP